MAYSALFVLIVAFLSHSLAAPAGHLPFKLSNTASRSTLEHYEATRIPDTTVPHDSNTKYCRQVHSPPSRCVDPPSYTDQNGIQFCSYRMCTPKYVEADVCPANHHLAAKAKCYEEQITRDVYKCDKTFEIKAGVSYCACIKMPAVTISQLKFITYYKPYCGPLTHAKEE